MFHGIYFPNTISVVEATNKHPYEPMSNGWRPDIFGPALEMMYGGSITNGVSSLVDPDPLTPLELADIEESLTDLRAGRYRIIPKDLSREDFLASL